MSNTSIRLTITVPSRGDPLVFESPEQIRKWTSEEVQHWQWVHTADNPYRQLTSRHYQTFQNQIEQWANNWQQQRNPNFVEQNTAAIQNVFNQFAGGHLVLLRGTPEAAFVDKVRQSDGEPAGVAAYTYLTTTGTGQNTFPQPKFFEGLIEAFLYKHEVDWTAKAHQEVLERLKHQYAGNISQQDSRFKDIEKQNADLNTRFENELKTHTESLASLHVDQSEAFKALVEKYDGQLKSIEETYDQKLALQKPVTYWETKEKYHSRLSKNFAWAASIVGCILIVGMISLIHWLFSSLQPGQDPRHWELGVLATAAFFSIWLTRILLRLFFSHVHLASDAAERRTMILTYLALSREGADVAPEDRKLILQHLFRSASDGLVKDDAAPPSIIEYLTRNR